MPKKRQALVEFEDILGACNAVNYAADNQIYIAGHPAFVNYSTSQKISRPGDTDDSRGVNNVLLFTILNPIYSITTDVLYTICNPCGPVQRIVIFRKNGVQAMVEFDSVQSAQRAKASLNGADIYSGCCTLKIEYAKPTRLNVFKNDQDTWDYTNPNLSGQAPSSHLHITPGTVLQRKSRMGRDLPLHIPHTTQCRNLYWRKHAASRNKQQLELITSRTQHRGPRTIYSTEREKEAQHATADIYLYLPNPDQTEPTNVHRTRKHSPEGPQNKPSSALTGDRSRSEALQDLRIALSTVWFGRAVPLLYAVSPAVLNCHHISAKRRKKNPVLMVYGLDQSKMNCDRVFNIFCLYGNVEKVKFMKSKPGAAMVEMADGYAVDRAITHLNNNFMFGQKLNVCVSKQQAIMPGQSYGLEDGSCSYKDFSGSRNNRFSTPEQAAKNRIQHPSNVLHFFNAPLEVTEDNFYEVRGGLRRPVS
ncbi:PREDICTED: heterogeneous nuclear ribonucleoprotein L [Nipponia nippon]|uniref:heterogeneous nuclear ribonucleoprotein L n=1 Tax=Nipponia nippon TaxID=128390 RepID=UPI0005110329|nr:PREDICTED: heterogeneous nuclear ribonucleoprotein L [Nipponia nippon]